MKMKRHLFQMFFVTSFVLSSLLVYFSVNYYNLANKIETINQDVQAIKYGSVDSLKKIYKEKKAFYGNGAWSHLLGKFLLDLKTEEKVTLTRLALFSPLEVERELVAEQRDAFQKTIFLFGIAQLILIFMAGIHYFVLDYFQMLKKRKGLDLVKYVDFFRNALFDDFDYELLGKKILAQENKINDLNKRIEDLNRFKTGPIPNCIMKKNGDIVEGNAAFIHWVQDEEEGRMEQHGKKMNELMQKLLNSVEEDKEISLPYYSVKTDQHFICTLSNTDKEDLKLLTFYPSTSDELKEKNIFNKVKISDILEETIEEMTGEIQRKEVKVDFEKCQDRIFMKNTHELQTSFSLILKRVLALIDVEKEEVPRLEFISRKIDSLHTEIELKVRYAKRFALLKFDSEEGPTWEFFNSLENVERKLYHLYGKIALDNCFDTDGGYHHTSIKLSYQDLVYVTKSPFLTEHEVLSI